MVNSSAPKTFFPGDRPPESASLWVILLAGSVLFHVLLLLSFRLLWLRTARVELEPQPIAVELIQPEAELSRAASPNPARSVGNRATAPRATVPSTSTTTQSSSEPTAPAFPSTPVEPTPRPRSSRRTLQPTPTPPASRPQQPTPPRSQSPVRPTPTPTQPPESSRSDPPRTNQSSGPADDPDRPPSPQPQVPSDNSPADTTDRSETGGTGNPPSSTEGSGERGPQGSGTPIPPPQGTQVAVQVTRSFQKVDFKPQQARPRETSRQMPVFYLAKPGEVSLEVHLEIDPKGSVLNILGVRVLSSTQALPAETINDMARQIFTNWSFEPAQDGQPLRPVHSDLFLEARIILR